jgi:hypothetical protein
MRLALTASIFNLKIEAQPALNLTRNQVEGPPRRPPRLVGWPYGANLVVSSLCCKRGATKTSGRHFEPTQI